jgi:SAM-dependent methyltransferase
MIDHARILLQPAISDALPLKMADHSVLKAKGAPDSVADIYNEAGDGYGAYADGDPTRLFAFEGLHAYADRRTWAVLDAKLSDLRASGATSISLLDAGCGPGTWLRRLVVRARALGFTRITARGFDIAETQIRRARLLTRHLSSVPGLTIGFDVADLTGRLPEAEASVDITICLYSVLSHLPVADLAHVSKEIARVTTGHFITTVRPVGSPPTAFVESINQVRQLKQDHLRNRCEIELSDGRLVGFGFHLFTAAELRECFGKCFNIEGLRGLDLFHTRFMPDARWNPACTEADSRLSEELVRLEETHSANAEFMDRAAHLLLVARSRTAATLPSL